MILPILILMACPPFSNGKDDTGHDCGPGTHWDGEYCVPGEDTDSDADADTDTDTDADGDTDADADSDTDTDPVDADGDGYSIDEGDCDDGDASVNPGAEEVCGNGVDDNCDGSANDCGWSGESLLPDVGLRLGGHRASDMTGCVTAVGGDTDGDGHAEILVGAPYRDDGATATGAVYLVDSPIAADMSLEDGDAVLRGSSADDIAGTDLAFLGDTNGDGFDDFAVGARGAQETSGYGRFDGTVWVVHGPVSGSLWLADLGEAWTPATEWEGIGHTLAAVGDVTGDGSPDLLVGAPNDSSYTFMAGAAWILDGPAPGGGSFSDAEVQIYGTNQSHHFGAAVSGLGDVDGDGLNDFVISDPSWFRGGTYAGRLSVFLGPVSGSLVDSAADVSVYGTSNTLYLASEGYELGGPGDLDGDGHDDLVAVHPSETDGGNGYAGAAYIVSGNALHGEVELFLATGKLVGSSAEDMLGVWGASGVGDVDRDGRDDLLVGAMYTDMHGENSGTAYLVAGPITGTNYAADVAVASFSGDGTQQAAGVGLSGGVDLTGDGVIDLLVGASGADGDEADAGAVFLVPGTGF